MMIQKAIATVAGIGYIKKGGGTVASLACLIAWYCLFPAGEIDLLWQVCITLVVILLGVWSGNAVDAVWGKDSSKVVIDEVAGMMIGLISIPYNIWYGLIVLTLFRFFDIAKPLGVRKMERLPKGWGVMADDVLAGIYTQIVMQVLIGIKLLR